MNQQRIAIIGAGISGLACATEWVKCGFEVSVFDKSKGVGGRMSHRHFQEWGADHGAQYFTVKDERFAEEVKKWQENDPIGIFNKYLLDNKKATRKALDEIEARVEEEVVKAVEFAEDDTAQGIKDLMSFSSVWLDVVDNIFLIYVLFV